MALTLTIKKDNDNTSRAYFDVLDNNITERENVYSLYRVLNNVAEVVETKTIYKKIKVAFICPNESFSYNGLLNIKKWMEDPLEDDKRGAGRGVVDVTVIPVRNDTTNKLVKELKNEDGSWRHDIIFLGHEDASFGTVTAENYNIVEEWVTEGRPIIASHYVFGRRANGFAKLREHFGIKTQYDNGHDYYLESYCREAWITNESVNDPALNTLWKLPRYINVGYSPNYCEFSYADETLALMRDPKFSGDDLNEIPDELYEKMKWYLIRHNNTYTMLSGCHGLGENPPPVSPDMKKLMANLLYSVSDTNSFSESTSFIDEKCLDKNVPNIPEILDHMTKGDNRVYYEYSSSDNGTPYEYYVEKVSIAGVKERSNVVKAFTISEIKGYEYAVIATDGEREDETPSDKDWIFTSKTDFTHKLEYTGYNSIFIRAIDNAGNKSLSVIRDVYIESEKVIQTVIGEVPHAVKYNNRYRGPHESKKVNSLYAQVRFNLKKLRTKLEELDKKKDIVLEKPVNYNNKIILQADSIEELYERIKNR